MERTPEPELMDEHEQAAAYAAADWSESHGKIPGYFRDRFPDFRKGKIIDLGCGPADISIRFAKAFPETSVLGVDGSETMLGFGRRRIQELGLGSRITLQKRFLPDATLESRAFDAVICNSLLHHMAEPLAFWRTAARCGKPGAPVLIVDLLRPASHEAALRLVNEQAADAPAVLQRDFIASLHAAYTLDEVREQLQAVGLKNFRIDHVDELHFVAWGETPNVFLE
jgi:ubiquinone/menaquinone biosynthesis C-methylase UbiE